MVSQRENVELQVIFKCKKSILTFLFLFRYVITLGIRVKQEKNVTVCYAVSLLCLQVLW